MIFSWSLTRKTKKTNKQNTKQKRKRNNIFVLVYVQFMDTLASSTFRPHKLHYSISFSCLSSFKKGEDRLTAGTRRYKSKQNYCVRVAHDCPRVFLYFPRVCFYKREMRHTGRIWLRWQLMPTDKYSYFCEQSQYISGFKKAEKFLDWIMFKCHWVQQAF